MLVQGSGKISRNFQDCRIVHEVPAQFLQMLHSLITVKFDEHWEMGPQVGLVVQSDQQSVQPMHKLLILEATQPIQMQKAYDYIYMVTLTDIVVFVFCGQFSLFPLDCLLLLDSSPLLYCFLDYGFVELPKTAEIIEDIHDKPTTFDACLIPACPMDSAGPVLVLHPLENTDEQPYRSFKLADIELQ